MKDWHRRLAALEQGGRDKFSGYAVLMVKLDQTREEAQADWIAENGPVGRRQWIIFNFGGQNAAA